MRLWIEGLGRVNGGVGEDGGGGGERKKCWVNEEDMFSIYGF